VSDLSLNLAPKQKRFVEEYLLDPNATKAATKAGYSPKSASTIGKQLLQKPTVSKALLQKQKKRADKMGITAEMVLDELRKCGFSNMQDYMKSTKDGDPYLDFSALTRDQAAALSEVTVEDYVEGRGENARQVKKVKFKLADKLAALEKIGRHIGMFKAEEKEGNVGNLNLTVIQIMREMGAKVTEKSVEDVRLTQ
jgi:phage terminase small subunit